MMDDRTRASIATLVQTYQEAEAGKPVTPPPTRTLVALGVTFAIPAVGFGFVDNFLMIIAGDYIDNTIGVTLGEARTLRFFMWGHAHSDRNSRASCFPLGWLYHRHAASACVTACVLWGFARSYRLLLGFAVPAGISTLAAAGLGNMVSDWGGIGLQGMIEQSLGRRVRVLCHCVLSLPLLSPNPLHAFITPLHEYAVRNRR